jgi:hypothetical protein
MALPKCSNAAITTLGATVAVGLFASSCAWLNDPSDLYIGQIRNELSFAQACPETRIVVLPRAGPPGECDERPPPPQIAADPERLGVWHQHELERSHWCGFRRYFTAEACGRREYYDCWYGPTPSSPRSLGTNCKRR